MHTFLNTLMCSVLFIYLQLMYILLLNEFFWNSLNWVRALRIGMWIFQILMIVFFWRGAVNDKSLQSCLRFSRQEYWSGLPCFFQGFSQPRDRNCLFCLLHFYLRNPLKPQSCLQKQAPAQDTLEPWALWLPPRLGKPGPHGSSPAID